MPRKKATPEVVETVENTENLVLEGAETMDYETMINEGENHDNFSDTTNESTEVSVETFNESDFPESEVPPGADDNENAANFSADENSDENSADSPDSAKPRTRKPRRPRAQTPAEASVLTLAVGGEVLTQKDKENTIWHEIKNSQVTGTPLTGSLGKVERMDSGALITIIDYKGQRIAIPLKEMMITLERPEGQSDDEYNERLARVLNRMMGAEMDFIVRGITGTGDNRAAVASRKAAMLRLRRRFYLNIGTNGKPLVYPDRVVEARIVAVSQMAIRIEVFGVETSINSRDLSWGYIGDARDHFYVGDSVQVRVTNVEGDAPENLRISADIKSLTEDDTRDKLIALKPQTNCMGKITDVRHGTMFISLVDGVRAISHRCFDHRKPGRGDDVLFVVTRVDEEGGVALGIVARIVKRNI
jgi:hypothetical protein